MARPQQPEKVNFFSAIIFSEKRYLEKALSLIRQTVGETDFMSEEYRFSETDYYSWEMGENLKRVFVSFEKLRTPDYLPTLKLKCVEIENMLSLPDGRRTVNIDPGYIDFHKVVLSSCKYGSGKIYLSDGVYADIVLLYRDGRFIPLPWTFPDFRSGKYDRTLQKIRELYKEKMRRISRK